MICGSGREIALDSCTASHRIGIGGGERIDMGGVKKISAGEHSRKRSGMTRIGSGIDVSKDGSSLVKLCRDAKVGWIISHFVTAGTKNILDGENQEARTNASIAIFFEQYIEIDFQKTHNVSCYSICLKEICSG